MLRILLPGQITKVRLLLDVRENATVVPTKSVVIEKGGAYVFVIRPDSIAERRMIELGPEVNNRVIVERGVVPGERIVVDLIASPARSISRSTARESEQTVDSFTSELIRWIARKSPTDAAAKITIFNRRMNHADFERTVLMKPVAEITQLVE